MALENILFIVSLVLNIVLLISIYRDRKSASSPLEEILPPPEKQYTMEDFRAFNYSEWPYEKWDDLAVWWNNNVHTKLMPSEISKIIRRDYDYENDGKPIDVEELNNLLNEYEIVMPTFQEFKAIMDKAFSKKKAALISNPLGFERIGKNNVGSSTHISGELLAEKIFEGNTLIRYKNGDEIITKHAESKELYKKYIAKFGSANLIHTMPTGQQFLDWFNEEMDKYGKLKDVDENGEYKK